MRFRLSRHSGLLLPLFMLLLVGAGSFVAYAWQAAAETERARLAATAQALGATLAEPVASEALVRLTEPEGLAAFYLDRQGTLRAASGPSELSGIDWRQALAKQGTVERLAWQGRSYWILAEPLGGGGSVVLARPAAAGLPVGGMLWALGAVLLGGGLLAALARSHRQQLVRTVAQFRELGRTLASHAASPQEVRDQARQVPPALRAAAEPIVELAAELVAARQRQTDAEAMVSAFLQLGPHYVVLATLDGRVLDANPAFFARTNLAPEWLRGQPTAVLDETLPMEPLLELGLRSKRENAAISGIPYALRTDPETERPVEVSIRTVATTSRGDVVVILIADRMQQRRLEHQLDRFTDALDLMVDQRVAELTAGRDDLAALLTTAGLAIATFDRNGRTKHWNGPAERLTGRTVFTLRHFQDVVEQLCPEAAEAMAFTAWFWGSDPEPYSLEMGTPEGPRRVLWSRGREKQAGEVVQCVLVGMELGAIGRSGVGGPEAALEQIRALVAHLAEAPADAGAQPYVEVMREAVRRVEHTVRRPPEEPGGDGVAFGAGRLS